MEKKLRVPIKSTKGYLNLFNFIFGMTDTELEILAAFIDEYNILSKASININPFSTEIKKKVAQRLQRDDFNTLNNYIKSLSNKKAISKTTTGYEIHPFLLPQNEEKVTFVIQ